MSTRVKAIESVTLTMLKSNPPQYVARVTWTAHRSGWSQLRLEGAAGPKDGLRNLEMLAEWSEVGTGQNKTETVYFFLGTTETCDLGVRIYAEDNAVEARYDAVGTATLGGVGDAFPWSKEGSDATEMHLSEIVGRPIRVVKPGDVVLPVIVPGRVTILVDEAHRAMGVQVEPSLPSE